MIQRRRYGSPTFACPPVRPPRSLMATSCLAEAEAEAERARKLLMNETQLPRCQYHVVSGRRCACVLLPGAWRAGIASGALLLLHAQLTPRLRPPWTADRLQRQLRVGVGCGRE